METFPKYALTERERRWRADLAAAGSLVALPVREIEDVYLSGTRLRLRRMSSGEGQVFKLGKKYGKAADGAEPIANLYLTEAEYVALSRLPGQAVRKRRYAVGDGALDVYERPALAIFEREFASAAEALAYVPPPFVVEEVTGRAEYSGFALAMAAARER